MSKKQRPPIPQMRGVAAFLSTPEDDLQNKKAETPIEKIRLPYKQPRRYFDPEKMEQLVCSVQEHGILEPLLVRSLEEGEYELVAGERRYRAAQEAGLETVPIVVRELSDEEALQIALVENLQREDLNPVEETEGILQLLALRLDCPEDNVVALLHRTATAKIRGQLKDNVVLQQLETVEEVLKAVGNKGVESFRVHRLPLLNLPPEILESLRQGQLAYTKAKEIAKVKDEASRADLLKDSIAQSLSLTQIKDRVKALRPPKKSEEGVQTHFDNTFKRAKKAKLWDDPKRSKKLESLLKQIDKLLEEGE